MALDFRGRVALTLAGRGTTIGLGLISSVVTARWLGPEGRGVLATLGVVTGLALQFGNPGLHTGNVYFVAREPRRTRLYDAQAKQMTFFDGYRKRVTRREIPVVVFERIGSGK